MTKKADQSQVRLRSFIQNLQSCVPANLLDLFGREDSIGPDLLVAAACTMVSAISRPAFRAEPDWYERPLEALANCSHPLAAEAIYHVANNAQLAQVKLAAVRKLGRVAKATEPRALLRQLAKEGFRPEMKFDGPEVTPEMFREGALESIGELDHPNKADLGVVLDVVNEEINRSQESKVFYRSVDTLSKICKPDCLKRLINMMSTCSGMKRSRILAACAALNSKALREEKETLRPLFCDAIDAVSKDEKLCSALSKVAAAITSEALLKELCARYRNDDLARGRGSISNAAMKAYPRVDDALVDAYMAFAQAECNVRSNCSCVQGLARCAKAGRADRVLERLMHNEHPGYKRLVTSGVILEILGNFECLVNGLCNALDRIEDSQRRAQRAEESCLGIIGAALSKSGMSIPCESLVDLRRHVKEHKHTKPDLQKEWIEALSGQGTHDNPFEVLGKRIISVRSSLGTVALAECILNEPDGFSDLLRRSVLRFTPNVAISSPGELPGEAPLAVLANRLFSVHDKDVRSVLRENVVMGGKLNRYVFDLLRRTKTEFPEAAQSTLKHATTAEDAEFILQSLQTAGDDQSVRVLVSAMHYESDNRELVPRVRQKAISVFCDCAKDCKPEVLEDALEQIQLRFEDVREVRLTAYAAARKIAHPLSIVRLRERLDTDGEPKCKNEIMGALTAIREHLAVNQPDLLDVSGLRNWLSHVGDLADASLLDRVMPLVNPPHGDKDVVIAALECMAKLGDERAIPAIDSFIEETQASRDVMLVAKRTKAILAGRGDLDFFKVLARVFPEGSPVMDFDTNYEAILGPERLGVIADGLKDALSQLELSHWDDCVTKLDGVCQALVRHLYTKFWSSMRLDQKRAEKISRDKGYPNQLKCSEFSDTFPRISACAQDLHTLRGKAKTAHPEDEDGTPKPGVQENEAHEAMNQFRTVFTQFVNFVREKEKRN